MDATELGRWTRFAAKGGIGKCTAIQDCVAEQAEDLMFLKDDEITVLMQIPGQPDLYLGYCEGVVGHFRADAVRFHGRLKKPVLTKRQSAVTSPISRPSSSQSAFTVAARDAPSPAITTSFSTGSISAASPASSPHPERSLSHASSLATTVSNTASAPITPADEGCNSPTIAPPTPDSDPAPSPIRLGEIAKQLATDSPVHPRFSSFDPGTSRVPNDRDSSIYDDSEPSTRISVALSDGGAGIGLSLLQNFAGGGDDSDSDSDAEDTNDTSASSLQRTESPESTVEGPPDTARSESQYSQSPRSAVPAPLSTRSESPTSPSVAQPPPSARSESQYSDSPHSSAAPLPSAHSESDYGGEDWEGADDIYDDYRYSRYSVASKMSRFSKGSMHTLASNPEIVPPVPTEPPPRQSSESAQRGEHGRMGSGGLHRPSKLSESTSAPDEAALLTTEDAGEEPMSRLQKNRPAPLTFRKEPEPSPLLHATFGSPQASPTAPTATTASFASPTLVSPVYPTNTGAATNIRKRLERERDEQDDDLPADRGDASEGRSGQDLHVRDREDNMPMTAVSQAAEIVEERLAERRQTPPPTPAIPPAVQTHSESSAQSEKRMMMIANADPVSDQPPPPPYSVTAPPVASSSSAPPPAPVPAQPTAPQPGPSTIPPTHPQARPIDPNRPPASPQARQSLFLPHPGAPKPTASSAGPMYGRAPAPHPPPIHRGPPVGSIHHVLQIAMAARREGRPAPPTIYGRFEYDLASSVGPVPITFSLEPQNNVPANRAVRPPMPWTGAGPSRTGSPASMMSSGAPGAGPGPGMAAPEIGGRRSTDPAGRQNAMSPPLQGGTPPPGASHPIQRPGFTPVVGTTRPRSRSFSGFESGSQEVRMQALAQGSREEGAAPPQVTKPLQITTKRSKSAMAATPTLAANVPAPQRATVSHSSSVVRGVHAPSPLSLSVNNVVANASTTAPAPSAARPPSVRSPPPRALTNPLPTSSSPPPAADAVGRPGGLQGQGPGLAMARALSLDQAAATVSLNVNGIGRGSPAPQTRSPLEALQESFGFGSSGGAGDSGSPPTSPRSPASPGFPRMSPVLRHSRSAVLSTSSRTTTTNSNYSEGVSSPRSGTVSLSRPSVDTQRTGATSPAVTSPTESTFETSSVLGLKITKKNRPHMPPLRLVTSKDSSKSDPRSPTLSVNTSASEHTVDQETVQVQDMDFELVKPTMPLSPYAGSVDSLPIPSPIKADGFLRTDSPAMSTTSGSSSFRHLPSDLSPSDTRSPPHKENMEMEAHRHREQRWIAAMASVPASQARKSKKVRKLVLEGVPASVRYQVWATLTDSRGKRMEGLYQQLAARDKVPAFADIERDIRECFVDRPELQDGSLAKMLQAYLSMVPDVQYSRGLALIAGQLLLQSPEEDAFWTFISLMDTHLRPYFSNSVQLEVDASLFAKALEANDSASAKKLFGDMAISPATVCRPWFMAVFADTLAPDYLLRVWDVFLFEGVTFLFRVGLAIFSGCRRLILQATSPDAILDTLCHPPPTALPLNPEALIELAFTVKLKDDDVRKQRNKLEAQVKRRTQPRASPLTSTPTISLPKS